MSRLQRYAGLGELSAEQIRLLLDRARDLERDPVRDVLAGKVVGLMFLNPSLRTLSSFQAGTAQLGGSSFVVTPGTGTWKPPRISLTFVVLTP